MINSKSKILSVVLTFIVLSLLLNQARSQDSITQLLDDVPQADQQAEQPSPPSQVAPKQEDKQAAQPAEKKRFRFFRQSEEKERHRKELADLINKQRQETKELKKKRETKKAQEDTLKKKVMEKQTENRLLSQKSIYERNKEIRKVQKSNNTVEVITSEEDPLYIKKAQVLNSKTNFMGIKDVEFKYKLELHNQTPKIINFVLIVWERKLAFNDTQTLAKEIKVAKPITPYEKRIVEYNELDSKRSGETYKVSISTIVFEDGTQWKNPAAKDTSL